jgi:hypothetical protein
MPKFVMHVEKSKSWWSGTSTTLCGLTFKVEASSWFTAPTCPTCAALEKAAKQSRK